MWLDYRRALNCETKISSVKWGQALEQTAQVVEPPSLEVFEKHVEVAQWGHGLVLNTAVLH